MAVIKKSGVSDIENIYHVKIFTISLQITPLFQTTQTTLLFKFKVVGESGLSELSRGLSGRKANIGVRRTSLVIVSYHW